MNSFSPDAIASSNLLMKIFNYKCVPSLRPLRNDIMSLIRPEDQLKLDLYGDTSINNADNKKILLSTIKYIKETQRFST